MRFLCTMVLSRRALLLPTYRFPYVLGGVLVDHRVALADARAVIRVVRRLAAAQRVSNLDALAASVGVSIGRIAGGTYKGSVATVTRTGTGSSPRSA